MNSATVKALLRKRYTHPEWALCFEVANQTGAGASRYADAVAMSLWPSRGLSINGFEIKVSKQDFMSEIKNPDKSVPVQQYCDFWWVVAPAKAVDETLLPENWGWIEVYETQLRVKKNAPKLEAKPADRTFMAAMIRRANEVDQAEFNKAVSLEVGRQVEDNEKRIQSEVDRRTRAATDALKQLEDLKEKIGTDSWGLLDQDEIARAVKMVRTSGVVKTYSGIRDLHRQMAAATKRLEESIDLVCGKQEKLKLEAAE